MDYGVVQLGHLGLPPKQALANRDIFDRLVAIQQDAILRLAHLAMVAADDGQAIKALVALGVAEIALAPTVGRRAFLRLALAVAHALFELLQPALEIGPADAVDRTS